MSQGVVTQIISGGHMDAYLTARPQISYWRYKHQRYTNFAIESVNVPFSTNSTVSSGGQSSVVLPRQGDMLANAFIVIELPGIANVSTAEATPQTTAGYETKAAANTDSTTAYLEVVEETLHDTYMGLCSNKGHAASELVSKCVTADSATITGEGVPYWTPGIGHIIATEATIQLGGATIDTVYGEASFMMEELSGKPGKRLNEMVGKSGKEASVEDLKARSKFYQRLYAPLPFFFSKHSGSALSLVSLQFHDVTIKCTWRGVKDLVVNGSGLGKQTVSYNNGSSYLATRTVVRPNQILENTTSYGALDIWGTDSTASINGQTEAGTLLADSHVKVSLQCVYVYLSREERRDLAKSSFEQLITTTQSATQISSRETSIISKLNFNHAVTQLLFAVRSKYYENTNEWTNFQGNVDPLTSRAMDPVRTVQLKLNNHDRFSQRAGPYFRTVVPWMHNNAIPEGFVYSYSFAYSPDSTMPSGSCNFSRIDSSELVLGLDPALFQDNASNGSKGGLNFASGGTVTGGNSVTVLIYARAHNILRISLGVAGLAFSN